MIIEPGQKIREWTLGEEIGRGAIGVIYAAEHKFDDRPYAIKVLRPELSKIDELRQRFLREAKIATALKHENIVESYPAFEEAGRLFLPMEFLSGNSLKTLMVNAKEPWPFDVIRHYGASIARGLFHAHKQGYAHRDVKPGNVFVSLDGVTVKVVDFGLALGEGCERLTVTGTTVGTPNYLAPEVVDGERGSPRSDIYALGVVLFRLVCNHLPFRLGPASNALAIACQMREQQEAGLPRPRVYREDCPEDLDVLIHEMLQFDPDARPQLVDDVATRLNASGGITPPAFTLRAQAAQKERASTDDVVGIAMVRNDQTIAARPKLVDSKAPLPQSYRATVDATRENKLREFIRPDTSPTEGMRPPTASEMLTLAEAPRPKRSPTPLVVALAFFSVAFLILSIYYFAS